MSKLQYRYLILRDLSILALVLAAGATMALAQSSPATSVANYPGAGVLQAGDVWESFLPQATTPNFNEAGTYSTLGYRTLIRLGNFDRSWTTPGTNWPNAYPYTTYWYKNAAVLLFDPDPTFNPSMIGGKANPSYFPPAAGGPYYAQLTTGPAVNGWNDATRRYTVEPYWVDGTRRQHAVYEAAWPTNAGIDVKIRAHAFQGPNWNNLNDFVILEIELKNTGNLDMNMDGVAEKVGNSIKALAFHFSTESYMSISSYGTGARSRNDIVATSLQRQAAWIGDPDASGSPWAFSAMFCSASMLNPTSGNVDLGFNTGALCNYTDVWTGMVMIDVKEGGLPIDRSKTVVNNPTKQTIFGTHPIGVGAQRGWYVAGGSQTQVWSLTNPRAMFLTATGEWFVDGGRSRQTDAGMFNQNPNSNFFSGGTAGDITTFVPKTSGAGRPDGDFKSSNSFDAPSFEDGKADASTSYPTGWGKFSKGASNAENFNGDMFTGVGPFNLGRDSAMTIVMATVAGFRLEGIQRAVRAARWAYAQNYAIPTLPPMPEIKVSKSLAKSVTVEWDARAESDPEFAGYKIYRSSQYLKKFYLDEGMRVVDRYQENMVPGPVPPNLKKPVNPKFDAFGKVNSTSTQGSYQPDTWGTWDLIAVVPKGSLSSYPPATSPGYKYRYEDKDIVFGYSYWYYVAAYKEGIYAGPDGETTNRIETHSTNRNGATGLWNLTYPFAPQNSNFPKDSLGRKAIGAAVTRSPLFSTKSLGFGVANVGVAQKIPVLLTNPSDQTMHISNITSTNPAFSATKKVFSILPDQSVLDTLIYLAASQGVDSAFLLIHSDAIPTPDTLILYGSAALSGYKSTALWARWLDSTNYYGTNAHVAVDRSGNVLLAGMTRSGSQDFFTLVKYGPDGSLLWTARDTAGPGLPTITALVLDPSGNAYITGAFYATIKFNASGIRQWRTSYSSPASPGLLSAAMALALDSAGNILVTGYSATTTGNAEIATIKYTSSGERQWVALHNGPKAPSDSMDTGYAIATDASGNVYVAGSSTAPTTNKDIVVIKYDNAGLEKWVRRYNGPRDSTDVANSIAIDQSGNVYVGGYSQGINADYDLVVLKFNNEGVQQWVTRYDGPGHSHDSGSKLVLDKSANVYVVGSSYAMNQFPDILTVKYNSAGVQQWVQTYDGPVQTMDVASSLVLDEAGNVYVAGTSVGSLFLNELITLKYDFNGKPIWQARFGSDDNSSISGTSIAVDGPGNVFVGGVKKLAGTVARSRNIVVKYGQTSVSDVHREPGEGLPRVYSLEQNFPNPFNPATSIGYHLASNSLVTLEVFDVLGRKVATLVEENKSAGSYLAVWDASNSSSGVYFCRLRARQNQISGNGPFKEYIETKKLILLR